MRHLANDQKIILISIPIVLLILAVPYIFLFGTMGVLTVNERLNRRAFDSQLWKQGNQDEVRIRMVDSLLRQHKLIRKSRGEVVALIGEPDNTSYFREYDMVYRLGMESRQPFVFFYSNRFLGCAPGLEFYTFDNSDSRQMRPVGTR